MPPLGVALAFLVTQLLRILLLPHSSRGRDKAARIGHKPQAHLGGLYPSIPKPAICSGMKLADWARQNGLTYQTAWRMWKTGKLPVRAEQMPTGSVIVHVDGLAAVLDLALALPKDDRRRLITEVVGSL